MTRREVGGHSREQEKNRRIRRIKKKNRKIILLPIPRENNICRCLYTRSYDKTCMSMMRMVDSSHFPWCQCMSGKLTSRWNEAISVANMCIDSMEYLLRIIISSFLRSFIQLTACGTHERKRIGEGSSRKRSTHGDKFFDS